MGVIIENPGNPPLDLSAIAKFLSPEVIYIERTPTNAVIKVINRAKIPRKFTGIVHSLEFGSVTLTMRINGSPIPGLTNLIPGTTPFRALSTGGNILPVDGALEMVISRASQPRGLSIQIEYDWVI